MLCPRGVCMFLKYYLNVKVTTSAPKECFVILGDFLGGLGEANLNAKLFLILPNIQFRRVGHHFTDWDTWPPSWRRPGAGPCRETRRKGWLGYFPGKVEVGIHSPSF